MDLVGRSPPALETSQVSLTCESSLGPFLQMPQCGVISVCWKMVINREYSLSILFFLDQILLQTTPKWKPLVKSYNNDIIIREWPPHIRKSYINDGYLRVITLIQNIYVVLLVKSSHLGVNHTTEPKLVVLANSRSTEHVCYAEWCKLPFIST